MTTMRGHVPASRPAQGFNLVELMVSIGIFSIVMFWAAPSFGVWTKNARIRSVAEALQNDLRVAKVAALSQDRSVSLVLIAEDPVAANVGAATVTSSTRWLVRRNADPLSAADFLRGFSNAAGGAEVRVTPVAGSGGEVRFTSLGRLVTGATVGFDIVSTQTNDTNLRPLRVLVSPGGNVRMCDPDARLGTNDSRKC
jgi:type IV fimbrial biogenesis protein FimT